MAPEDARGETYDPESKATLTGLCNRCHRPMWNPPIRVALTSGACICGGLIEAKPQAA